MRIIFLSSALWLLVSVNNAIAKADLNLLCTWEYNKNKFMEKEVSLRKENGTLVYRIGGVVSVDGKFDRFGGYTNIEETPHGFVIFYEQKHENYKLEIRINRVKGTLIQKSKKEDGTDFVQLYTCKEVKLKF
jgi:hypothetical protein